MSLQATNNAYYKTGGYRFEMERCRRTGQALDEIIEQWKTRLVSPEELNAMGDLKQALNQLRLTILVSRDAAANGWTP